MRTVTLSLITREHARDFTDRRAHGTHPMCAVTQAALRFREYNVGREDHGRDLHRIVLCLTGTLPNIGLEDEEPYDWERAYGIWGIYTARESDTPYCKRMFAVMVNAEYADQLERDLQTMRGDTRDVIGALAAIFTGCRENEHPPREVFWPEDPVTLAENTTCVFLSLHANYHDQRGNEPRWQILRNASVTNAGVTVGEEEFNGFDRLLSLFGTT